MTDRITRQGTTPEDMPEDDVEKLTMLEPYTLERTLSLMDSWHDGMDWGLHQMCRALRAELDRIKRELPGVIGCPEGKGIECDNYPWLSCCFTRRKLCAALNVPVKEKPKFEFDKLDGYYHVFEPSSGREPRMSAGCFKMEGGV